MRVNGDAHCVPLKDKKWENLKVSGLPIFRLFNEMVTDTNYAYK